jgi:hypothetical protein
MSFLIAVFNEPGESAKFDDALELHQSWPHHNKEFIVDIATKHYRIACLTYGQEYACKLWKEKGSDDSLGSFVYILGWCYRIGSSEDWPNNNECRDIFYRQRNGQVPLDESYSGNYVVVVYDSERRKIVVQPDHWAMSGVYYSVMPSGIAVSNRSTAVASLVSASLDGYSVLSLLRGTHMPFGRTLFSDIHRVVCGCYLEINLADNELEVKRAYPIYIPVEKKSFADAAQIVGDTLCHMVRRWHSSRTSIFDLTGGNDTRLTAAAMLHEHPDGLGPNWACCVAGAGDHPDVRIAAIIAQVCNWPLLRLNREYASDASVEWLQKSVVRADGLCLADSAAARVKQEVNRGADWVWHIGSIGGELLRGFFWRHEFLSLGRTNRVDYAGLLTYRLYASREVDSKIFGKHFPSLDEHDEILLEPYRRIGELGNDALNPYKLDAMYMHKLCYSAGSTQSWLMGLSNIKLPLVGWELSKETLSIPWKLRATRRLVLQIINNIAPQLSKIPNDKGEPMKPLTLSSLPFYLKCGVLTGVKTLPRLINRYTGLLPVPAPVSTNPLPASWIHVVLEGNRNHSVFDPAAINKVCFEAGSASQSANLVRTFHTMLTVELLLNAVPNVRNKITFDAGPEIPS